ncbi:MAG: adenosylmethionine--8-amino-7-oxononanoate transaminase [Alphaproteobacteria bacterium]
MTEPAHPVDPRLKYLWRPYTQMQTEAPPLKAVETCGAQIKLEDGRWLIDGISSWWTACHGYNHEAIIEAMQKQLDDMPHVMFGGLTHEPALQLAWRLSRILPGSGTDNALEHIFFADSGSVAVEVALKMAVQYWHNKGAPTRTRFVAFQNAYHGDTTGAMSVCDPEEGMHALFKGAIPEQIIVELPETVDQMAAFEHMLMGGQREIAGVILEPLVQGAGGMRFHSPETLAAIVECCKRHHVLFIADEIATGFGRTGTMFACEQADVVPDIICIGKALTGGAIGMAATAANEKVFSAFLSDDQTASFTHGPTYMANPLAAAAANASLDLFEDGERLEQVARIEEALRDQLEPCRNIPGIEDVRVKGAIGVVQMTEPRNINWLRQRFSQMNVWVRPFGDVVYLMPPFIIGTHELTALTKAVVNVMNEWSKRTG